MDTVKFVNGDGHTKEFKSEQMIWAVKEVGVTGSGTTMYSIHGEGYWWVVE
jgi:hypothetical protein